MTDQRAEVLFHPVRLRVVQALIGRELTTQGLAEVLPDVPRATLYRHVRRLADAGIIEVAATQQVRGRTERTYRLDTAASHLGVEEAAALTPHQHARHLQVFVASLLEQGLHYLDAPDADPSTDGFGYQQVALWLDDAELVEFAQRLNEAVLPFAERRPGGGRRRRMLTTMLIPSTDAASDDP
ncbi:MAG: helix-turn-helix domain-containing protein [Nitriliruptoraceae bacterium]